MQRIPNWLKNKYVLTSLVFGIYFLFLDDWDIFTLVRQKRKLSQIEQQDTQMSEQLKQTKKNALQASSFKRTRSLCALRKVFQARRRRNICSD